MMTVGPNELHEIEDIVDIAQRQIAELMMPHKL